MSRHILVVEDEEKIARLIKDYLENSGFLVTWLNDGSLVIPRVKKQMPDLILLDVMLPGMDGMEICKEIRKFSTVPVIMITARAEEIDRLLGLELGADDYICKPFSPREVVARVKTVLRRVQPEISANQIIVGIIVLNVDSHQVMVADKELKLTPSEFGLLKEMMSQPGRVFSRNQLLNKVQGIDFEGYDRTIDTHIKNLRKKLGKMLPKEDIIQSIYGSGYKFSYGDDD